MEDFEYNREYRAAEDISGIVENASRPKTRAYSVLSLVIALAALLVGALGGWFGLGFSLLSLGFAASARVHLGYFDRTTVAALVLALCALVFSVASIVFVYLLESGALDAYFAPFFDGYGDGGGSLPPIGSF